MTKTKKLLLSLLVVGIAGSIAAFGVFSAFSSTTTNSGNQFTAGTVAIGDNDGDNFVFNNLNAAPGATATKCVKVDYTGSLDADVSLYIPEALGDLKNVVNLTIQPGSFPGAPPASNACTGFVADGAAIFNNTLDNWTHTTYANGLVDGPGVATYWQSTNSVVYQITATVSSGATNTAQGDTTNALTFTWEARNR